MSIRTYYDPLHQAISLDSTKSEEALIMELIDSIPFQRLRRIRQLGPASLTFHGAESSRFTHSLGVFHIARRALDRLIQIEPSLKNFRQILYVSALLHDLGHGSLSHTSEGMFNIKHEEWSAKLIKEHPAIKDPLETFSKGSSDKISKMISGKYMPNKAISSLLSSQLDCDRLDYLMRDSYSTGTKYGLLDLDRILSALTISPDGDIAIHPKGILAVEHYLVIRILMYKSVYNHRLNEVSNWLLEKIIQLAIQLGPNIVWTDSHMKKWLWNKSAIDIDTFLANDDVLINYHLSKWKEGNEKNLSFLCSRYINRELFKSIEIESLNNENQLKALSIARSISKKIGFDPDLSCGIRKQKLYGYHPYKGGLRIWDGQNLKALEEESMLVKSLIIPYESTLLIHEKEVHEKLKEEIKILGNEQI